MVADRIVPKEYYKAPLLRVWKPMGSVVFNVIGENLFIAEFEYEWDKTRIMEGRPWLFDGNLVSLKEFDGFTPPTKMCFDQASFWIRMYNLPLACMGKSSGYKIGSSVGDVEEVDVLDEDAGWGEYLRVKISLDLTKPLARGRMLHLEGRSSWVAFKYEKLPKFCYTCGTIKHSRLGCAQSGSRPKAGEGEEQQYGPWLRVPFPPRRSTGSDYRYGRSRNTGESGGSKERRDTENGSENTTPSSGSPAVVQKEPFLESMQGSRDVIKTGVTSLIFGRESGELEAGTKAIVNKGDYGNNITASEESDEINEVEGSSGPKKVSSTKYVGCWDPLVGRMTYEQVDEHFSEILLERDPKNNSYHPRVVPRPQENANPVFHFKASAPSHTEKSTEHASRIPPGPVSQTDKESTPNQLIATDTPRQSPVSVANWKKRARKGQNSGEATAKKTGVEGKRKVAEDNVHAQDEAGLRPKKGRKAEGLLDGTINELAVAVEQPRQTQ